LGARPRARGAGVRGTVPPGSVSTSLSLWWWAAMESGALSATTRRPRPAP